MVDWVHYRLRGSCFFVYSFWRMFVYYEKQLSILDKLYAVCSGQRDLIFQNTSTKNAGSCRQIENYVWEQMSPIVIFLHNEKMENPELLEPSQWTQVIVSNIHARPDLKPNVISKIRSFFMGLILLNNFYTRTLYCQWCCKVISKTWQNKFFIDSLEFFQSKLSKLISIC